MAFQNLPGFRDFYPSDMLIRQHVFTTWRAIAHRYGFKEYDGPPLEPLELYIQKSGEEIVSQLFNFTDKGDREVALRPEMTPTLARMIGAKGAGMPKPIKWFAIPQLFRYEKPQKGRLREHFQFNMDIFGEPDIHADAELIAAAIDTLRAFGLTEQDFVARISDRRLLSALCLLLGANEEQLPGIYAVIDKWEREPREISREKLIKLGLNEHFADRLEHFLKIHNFDDFWAEVQTSFSEMSVEAMRHLRLQDLFDTLEHFGLRAYLKLDLTIVRGLAYYTGVVFELFDVKGELRAIAGGGRYDNLLASMGYDPMPALGFGMGDVVLGELLKQRGLLPTEVAGIDDYLIAVSPEAQPTLLKIAHKLRDRGRSVSYSLKPLKMGKQFQQADALKAQRAIIFGPDELANGQVKVKDLKTGEESLVTIDHIVEE